MNEILREDLKPLEERMYASIPFFVDVTDFDDENIQDLITVLEKGFNGVYRFSKEAFSDNLAELVSASRSAYSHKRTYIGIMKKAENKYVIYAMSNISDIGCTVVTFEFLKKYVAKYVLLF